MKYKDPIIITHPELAKEWHPTKNGKLTPNDVTAGSNKKVWWMDKYGHEWEAIISSRSRGRGCPYCAGRKVCKDNCLATTHPELAKEWHPTKNADTPNDVTAGSDKIRWWIDQYGHEWEAKIRSRSRGRGCPYCAGVRVCKDNCLATTHPHIAKEWHPEKNGQLTPDSVTSGSGEIRWWMDEYGHEWEAQICNRSRGKGCPYCAGQKVCKDNCLATTHPHIAKEWHPEKNGNLTPNDVTAGSGEKVWWMDKYGHEWEATIYSRSVGRGCPYCTNRKVNEDNCLTATHPHIAKEWHPEKKWRFNTK